MLGIFVTLTLFVSHQSSFANSDSKAWVATLPKPWQVEQSELATVLEQFHARYPDYHQRLRAIAYWRLGTPYKIFNLGEEVAPDPDPFFRLDVSDCTSHILTSLALAQSSSWQQSVDTIKTIHYKPGLSIATEPSYQSRWHFTSDRLLHHPMTPDITADFAPAESLKTLTINLNTKKDDTEFLPLNWSKKVTVNYILNEAITEELLNSLPDFIGVAFVKESYFDMGLVIAHEGMLLDGSDLLHAGQDAKKTVIEDFMSYYFSTDGAKFNGIMLYEFLPSPK